MNINYNVLRRPTAAIMALALVVGAAAPALFGSVAQADQLTSRSIRMSDSGPSGGTITSGVGSGAAVKYTVNFTTSAAMQSVVVDFCANTPLIGDTNGCTAPTALNLASATVTGGTWTLTAAATQAKLAAGSSQSAGAISFELNNITNPSTLGSFYARITTYTNATWGTYASAASVGNYVDYGGVALSTTTPITVTARVMETMTLCTSAAAPTLGCGGTTPPSITIGHGVNTILDASLVDTTPAYSQVSTNATNGYAIYLRASNACAGLSKDGGTTCPIPAVNAGGSTSATITAGTAAFGVSVSDGTSVVGGTGTNAAVARWKTTAPDYIMDNTTASDNVGYVYGSKVADSAGQANGVNNTYTFAATASPTTPAGVYTENFSLIAVGTF